MKNLTKFCKATACFVFFILLLISCSKSDDDSTPNNETKIDNEVHEFIWKGLNNFYLWKDEVPNLADNRFPEQDDFNSFLNSFDTPEDIFEALLYRRGEIDKFGFSRITDDLTELKSARLAATESNGLNFLIGQFNNSNSLYAVVTYIANNSDASNKEIKRGDIILTVDGQELTISNIDNLLFGDNDTYTLGLGVINGNTISDSGETVELTKSAIDENPILISDVFEINGKKIGYIVYNEFVGEFDTELNNIFGDFKSQGVTDLVLDFRYNSGGDVFSAIHLSSMVTGQFTGELLMEEEWNADYQEYFEKEDPEFIRNNFTDKFVGRPSATPINSLSLSEVYILTTNSSASASELVINCLKPYINVIQIGENTFGKYVGSIAVFDSPNFSSDNTNPDHTYAMQPITFKVLNANGVTDYFNGLEPTIVLPEDITNLGTLGDINEPLLAEAISLITGLSARSSARKKSTIDFKVIADSKDFTFLGKSMYIDKPIVNLKN